MLDPFMLEPPSDEALVAFRNAGFEAREQGRTVISIQDVILGILMIPNTFIMLILDTYGCTYEAFKQELDVRGLLPMKGSSLQDVRMKLGDDVLDVLELAGPIAELFGAEKMAPEHIFLAVLDNEEHIISQIFKERFGVTYSEVFAKVREL